MYLILHFPQFIEISEEKWKLAEQTRKFNKLRPFEQADYKKKHPNFEPVINWFSQTFFSALKVPQSEKLT